MYIVIKIYIIVCILLLVFDIAFLFVKNLRTSKFYPTNNQLESDIRASVAARRQTGRFPDGFEADLGHKLSHTKNLITLENEAAGDKEVWQWFRPVILSKLDAYRKKSDYEQAYYAYVVSLFDYSKDPISPEFASRFLFFLDSKSLYTFSNAMNALYAFGEDHLLLMALDKMDAQQGFYKKLLVDGLLGSKVNFQSFNEKLLERFDLYSPYMQDCLLDYLRMNGHDITPLCTRLLLAESTPAQVRYSAARYFIKHPKEESRKIFLNILTTEEKDWVLQMLSIQGLNRYDDPQVRSAIKAKVTDLNWYIRVNAIRYLHDHGLSRDEVFDILYLQDRYANNALLYQFHGDKEMSRYIINTIELLDEQQKQASEKAPNTEPLFV